MPAMRDHWHESINSCWNRCDGAYVVEQYDKPRGRAWFGAPPGGHHANPAVREQGDSLLDCMERIDRVYPVACPKA